MTGAPEIRGLVFGVYFFPQRSNKTEQRKKKEHIPVIGVYAYLKPVTHTLVLRDSILSDN